VTFDYAAQKLYLRRIVPQPADIGTFDRSGLWLNASGEGFAVMDVASNSAGALAGIEVGDVITTIDGRPVAAEQLADIRRMLRVSPVGHRVELTVRRRDAQRSVALILEDQI
jgi:S1-C subfamily serine protease